MKENKTKFSTRRKGWMRNNKLVMHLTKRLSKALRAMRKQGRKVTTRAAFACAQKIYQRIDGQKQHLTWPVVRRTGEMWAPKWRWVQAWFDAAGRRPRRPTKKRRATAADDSAAMQKFCDFLRFSVQQRPPCQEAPPPHLVWGYYDPRRRYNRDQIGLEFDFTGRGSTWASPEERRLGHVAVRTGPAAWAKRFVTIDLTLSADLSQEQPPAIVLFRGQGRVSDVERNSYHPDVRIIWTPKAYLRLGSDV